ncbi:endonuclease [Pasteurellaceae bacterium RH1A]|nr:endonuclease [Pasteurellaceae bacterium RH1A]
MSDWLLSFLLGLPILATLLPLLPFNHWTVRIFDFPRPQIAVLNLLCLVLGFFFSGQPIWWFVLLQFLNLACMAYQIWEILAYTRLAKPTVLHYAGPEDERSISLLTSNVLTPNRQVGKLLALIEKWQPDVVLTLETDQWWEDQLAVIEETYPYTVKIPLDNLYGMHLYSRLPLRNTEIRHWVQEDIPSIYTETQLRSGEWIEMYCLHPMPPTPTESATSTNRDAELLLVGQEITQTDKSVLVFGDLNDVAWSATSRLFQKTSGLLDPRIGRGLYSTFHAQIPICRWPLDHIFHSNDFMMREIHVLPEIGSDHFPVYGSFQYHPKAEQAQPEPKVDSDDHQEAQEKIDEAEPEMKVIAEKY